MAWNSSEEAAQVYLVVPEPRWKIKCSIPHRFVDLYKSTTLPRQSKPSHKRLPGPRQHEDKVMHQDQRGAGHASRRAPDTSIDKPQLHHEGVQRLLHGLQDGPRGHTCMQRLWYARVSHGVRDWLEAVQWGPFGSYRVASWS